jgi:DNA-binding NtrC family response regulator
VNTNTILVVDDEPDIRQVLEEILIDENYSVLTAGNANIARQLLREHRVDLVLLDIWMPDTDGITLLKEWSEQGAGPQVVIISGHGNVETAVDAVRFGAYDFLEKPLSTAKLLVTVERALRDLHLTRENQRLRRRLEPASTLIGTSTAITEIRQQLQQVANTDSWVLITGEPGSGKGVVARCLHNASARSAAPFIDVSLAAIPDENIGMELFGSTASGMVHPGRFEEANGGTLFLDEIGDLDLAIQAKILSALEQGRFIRIGGGPAVVIDVRIIAATNQDIDAAVASGRFREDLYYRINVIPIKVPPLRDHREDIPDLVAFYVNWIVEQEQLPYRRFTTGALNILRNYQWPGNVRELKNLVQRLLIFNHGTEIDREEAEWVLNRDENSAVDAIGSSMLDLPLREARDQFEKHYLNHHLEQSSGNISELAHKIGIERTHLYRKLKGYGIKPKPGKSDAGD